MEKRSKIYLKKLKQAFVLLAVIIIVSSCRTNNSGNEKRTLRMVYTDWSESVAITYLANVLLEERMEYDVVLKLTDVKSAYEEVARGESDVFADAWLPETQKRYYDEHSESIELIGIIYPEARTGLIVPDYSRFNTISDLKNYTHPVVGIDPNAGVMLKTKQAFNAYALPLQLQNLSEDEMLRNLEDSIKRRKEVVVTGWDPHWIFARYHLRFLDDPDNVFGEREKIYSIGSKNIEETHPRVVRFFERMQLSEKQFNQLIYQVQINEDPLYGVKQWIDQNEYVVNQWVKNLKPERKKIM